MVSCCRTDNVDGRKSKRATPGHVAEPALAAFLNGQELPCLLFSVVKNVMQSLANTLFAGGSI